MKFQMETYCEFIDSDDGFYECGTNPYTGQFMERWIPVEDDENDDDDDDEPCYPPSFGYSARAHAEYNYWCER